MTGLGRGILNDGGFGRDGRRPTALVSGGLGRQHRPCADALVSGDVLSAAAADRRRARPELQPDRLDPDLPVRGRRDLQHPGRHFRRHRRPQGPADGGGAVLDRLSLSDDGLFARLLDDARLRDPARHRQQPLASDRDPVARQPLPRAQGPGDVVPQHGRQCRRRGRAAGGRRAARGLQLARRRADERHPRHRDVGADPDLHRPHL